MDINDSWRLWIAENLALGADPDELARILDGHGVAPSVAATELRLAQDSPYLQGARGALRLAGERLAKREWVLDIYRTLRRQTAGSEAIERRHQLSREDFYRDYYLLNRPVIITGMLDDWPALHRWDHAYLRGRAGDAEVEVQLGRAADSDYEGNSASLRRRMRFGDYLDLVDAAGDSNDVYMTANNATQNRAALAVLWADIGRLPTYLDPASPDDGFLWIGPRGTRTPLHHDLTNNFMAQVRGRKRIRMVPAYDTARVYNHRHCFSAVDGFAIDYQRFPQMRDVALLDCVLAPGEILFLPVGSWHCVEALDASVTVSMINFLRFNDFSAGYTTYGEL
jgi:ribosomal protein L16 Arg81 hydroxylase